MKKSWKMMLVLCLILSLLMSLCVLSLPAGAEGETPAWEPAGTGTSGDYEYKYYADGTACITDYYEHYGDKNAELVIPAELDGHPVTTIGDYAFYYCESLTAVTIPDSVTYIGWDAFFDCPLLTLTVNRDSYAAQYCKDNGIAYQYADANDWLLN